jgi:hypothetical protein
MTAAAFTQVLLERSWDPPLTDARMRGMSTVPHDCFGLHRVTWQGSMLSADGRTLVCHFSAPDAESARIALKQLGADVTGLWAGTVIDAPDASGHEILAANVVVTRRFDEPVEFADLQAVEDGASACLEMHGVRFLRSFFSADRRRMICLYRAPDADCVRIAQRQARMPVETVWAFRRHGPESIAG